MARGKILVGTCNWADHKDFYPRGLPAGERLGYYARFFNLVEVDTTFYGIPKPEVAQRWVDQTPEGFLFNVKAYRSLTLHEREDGKPRPPTEAEEHDFLEVLKPIRAAARLRSVHYQFPPWFTATVPNMDYVSRLPDRHPRDQLVVEFRHRSWSEPARFDGITELLAEAGMTYCVVDEPQLGSGSMPPTLAVTDPRLAVVRFHGRNHKKWYVKDAKTSAERFDYLYSEKELEKWVPRLHSLAEEAAEVHALFNNNRGNYAVVNGLQMGRLLGLDMPVPEALEPTPATEQAELPLG